MKPSRMMAIGLLVLTGCADSHSDYGQYFQLIRQTVNGSFSKTSITLKQAAAIPYASMGWRLDGGSQNIIVLATVTAQNQIWTSAAHIVLMTENGRVQRTVGLPHDLGALISRNPILAPPAAALKGPYRVALTADFPDLDKFGLALDCQGAADGTQVVDILGKKLPTLRVQERCQARGLDWRFTNIYWVDRSSGVVWRSQQHIHPHGDILETEVFRPPE